MEEHTSCIRKILKEAHDRKKKYFDMHRMEHSFEEGKFVFLRVKPQKRSIRFGKGYKISPHFDGSFEMLENSIPMAYCLALLPVLHHMHDVFHVSVLRKYVHDPSHI
jgi:hypothetical protein